MAAKFAANQAVRVRKDYPPGHLRTPYYCRGKLGVIERVLPAFVNPEEEGYGRVDGEKQTLYRIRFAMRELWPEYPGPSHDGVEIEIYEHWIEPA